MSWINVHDMNPSDHEVVLVKVYREARPSSPKQDFMCTATRHPVTRHCGPDSPIDYRWYVFPSGGHEVNVTHWQPLPKDNI